MDVQASSIFIITSVQLFSLTKTLWCVYASESKSFEDAAKRACYDVTNSSLFPTHGKTGNFEDHLLVFEGFLFYKCMERKTWEEV